MHFSNCNPLLGEDFQFGFGSRCGKVCPHLISNKLSIPCISFKISDFAVVSYV